MLEPIIVANHKEFEARCCEVWEEWHGTPFNYETPWEQEEAELALAVINFVRQEWGLPMYQGMNVRVV